MNFTPEALAQLLEEYSKLDEKYAQLLSKFQAVNFQNQDAGKYAGYGFMRRLGTLKKCIQNVYALCPPDKSGIPSDDDRMDIDINLQAFIFNVFGCLDNLAWVWVKEKQLKNKNGTPLGKGRIGLVSVEKNQIVRESFSQDFQDCLNSLSHWFGYLEDFRHSLAHGIPLYVPPFSLNTNEAEEYADLENKKWEALKQFRSEDLGSLQVKQDNLKRFMPHMTHSFSEKPTVVLFHGQILTDWITVIGIAERFIQELTITSAT